MMLLRGNKRQTAKKLVLSTIQGMADPESGKGHTEPFRPQAKLTMKRNGQGRREREQQ